MECRGLVERSECSEDGRGGFIGVTVEGHVTIEQAARGTSPPHAASGFDLLDANDVAGRGVAIDKLMTGLHEPADDTTFSSTTASP